MTHIHREEARAIPNEQRWVRATQRHRRRIVFILRIKHEKERCGWVQMLVNKLHNSREHIAQAMAEESHMILPVAALLWMWEDHQGISCPHTLSERKQGQRFSCMLRHIEPGEKIPIFRSCF